MPLKLKISLRPLRRDTLWLVQDFIKGNKFSLATNAYPKGQTMFSYFPMAELIFRPKAGEWLNSQWIFD